MLRVLQHQITFAEPALHGAAIGEKDGQADQDEHDQRKDQRRLQPVVLPDAVNRQDFQDNAQNAGDPDARHEGFRQQQAKARQKEQDQRQVATQKLHRNKPPFFSASETE